MVISIFCFEADMDKGVEDNHFTPADNGFMSLSVRPLFKRHS